MRGATRYQIMLDIDAQFQSTLLMRGATCAGLCRGKRHYQFQSTLLMRGATSTARARSSFDVFQSTLLMRGATDVARFEKPTSWISIHAPHARSDEIVIVVIIFIINFNPRSSCEERLPQTCGICRKTGISIHAPHARSDFSTWVHGGLNQRISIHAPHARSDIIPC